MSEIHWVPHKTIDKKYVDKLFKISVETKQFTNNGPNVRLLEQIIRDKLQIDTNKAVIAVTNGTVALHALASGINHFYKKKLKWTTQSFTFPPSAQGVLSDTLISDIDHDGGLDLTYLDNKTDGIIVTNIFGNVVDIDKYTKWANDNNKILIFDNAATPFTFYKNKNSCNYGDGCVISFHHTKPIGFGEGGAIIVDKKYENNIRCLNNFGIGLSDYYWMREGNNNKMSDISAIYIIQYLDKFDQISKHHMKLYQYFKEQIIKYDLKLKLFPSFHDDENIMPSCFCILFNNYNDNIKLKLMENNIFCRKYYHPLKNTKVSQEIYNDILCLPCTIDMDLKDVDLIIKLINEQLFSNN